MFIEHVAFAVSDPEAAATWYSAQFGMRIVGRGGGGDVFVADDRGHVMLQLEDARRVAASGGEAVDYRNRDMRLLHLAFWADDVAGERARLLAAGATADDEVITTPAGDVMTTIRDPWGVPIQILRRKQKFLE